MLDSSKDKAERVYIDAEQSEVNPIIEKLAEEAVRAGHKNIGITIQALLCDVGEKVTKWTELANETNDEGVKYGETMGIKLVRGAYMEHEKKTAGKIHADGGPEGKPLTDKAYNEALVRLYLSGGFDYITAATHNTESVKLAANLEREFGSEVGRTKIEHAKLHGMGNNLPSYGLDVLEYLPYSGEDVLGIIAYQGRRVDEFRLTKLEEGITRGVAELKAVIKEVKTRFGERLRPVTKLIESILPQNKSPAR